MHGLADCSTGWMIGTMSGSEDLLNIGAFIILYNTFAFGGQLPAGILLDKIGNPKFIVAAAAALIVSGVMLASLSPVLAVILAGTGSCFFHAGGGMMVLAVFPGKASMQGIFTGPGIAGLSIGGYLAIQNVDAGIILPALLILSAMILATLKIPSAFFHLKKADSGLDHHDILMIALLFAISMRSAVWTVFDILHKGEYMLAMWIGLAAFSGKLAGGYLADFFGWRRYLTGALCISAVLLSIDPAEPLLLLPGIALLQSATPAAISGMHRLMPGQPGAASGLTLGLALAIGGLPFFSGLSPGDLGRWGPVLGILIAGVLFYFVLAKKTGVHELREGKQVGHE